MLIVRLHRHQAIKTFKVSSWSTQRLSASALTSPSTISVMAHSHRIHGSKWEQEWWDPIYYAQLCRLHHDWELYRELGTNGLHIHLTTRSGTGRHIATGFWYSLYRFLYCNVYSTPCSRSLYYALSHSDSHAVWICHQYRCREETQNW